MNKLFECLQAGFFEVPDGTLVNPFLNPKDVMSGLPWDILDGLSIAAGQVNPGVISQIHIHPFVTQVTVLLSGSLDVHMKDPGNQQAPYKLSLELPAQTGDDGFTSTAVLTPPGTFFQLDNSVGSAPAEVLYLTSPSYIFEPGENGAPPLYDDAIWVAKNWADLAEQNWISPELCDPARSYAARRAAIQRLAARSRAQSTE